MKTKTFFVGIIVLTLSVMLPSCGVLEDPDTWAVEIEDSYRAQVALAFGYAVYEEESVDAFAEKLEAEAEKANDESGILDGDCPKFKLALEKMSKEDEMAADILDGYNKLDVKFSEWTKQPKEDGFSIWTATEENSGVKVTFKNNSMLEWDLDLDEESLVAYFENIVAALSGSTQSQTTQTGDKWMFDFWKSIMGSDFNTKDEQYLKKKYPSGITTEKVLLTGEYEGDERKETIPTEDVIIDVITNHYNDPWAYGFPTPECVGEFIAKVYGKDYYKHLDARTLCNVNQLCQDLIHRGEFEDLMQNLEKQSYPLKVNTIKSAKTQQEKDICEVLNAWAYIALGNGDADPTMELMGKYFDFID